MDKDIVGLVDIGVHKGQMMVFDKVVLTKLRGHVGLCVMRVGGNVVRCGC